MKLKRWGEHGRTREREKQEGRVFFSPGVVTSLFRERSTWKREITFCPFLSLSFLNRTKMPSTTVGTIAPAAVVLAGERPGALYPLDAVGSGGGVASGIASSGSSSASSSSSSPPPPLLLPLAGAPLISYPLRALEASGVRRIIIVSSFADAEREKERERETETERSLLHRPSASIERRHFLFFLSPLFDLFLLSPSPLRVNHPQVVNGDAAASKVSSWASKAYPSSSSSPSSSSPSPPPPAVSVVAAPEDASTADALALALPLLGDAASTPAFLCVPGDLVTDVSFGPAVLRHFVSGAGVTALLARARASPAAASGGAGKAPRGRTCCRSTGRARGCCSRARARGLRGLARTRPVRRRRSEGAEAGAELR